MNREITEAFGKTCQLLSLRGYKNVGEHKEVIYEKIDDAWGIKFNPTMQSMKLDCGYELPCMSVSVEHKGFPVGVFNPVGGAMMSEAEADYIAAIDNQLSV